MSTERARSGDGNETTAQSEPSGIPLDLVLRACSLLPPNDIACSARLLCKASAQHFSAPHHRTVRLSQPVPPPVFAARYGRGADPGPLKELAFGLKERLLALTASSGVVENVAALVERMEPPFWWRQPGKPDGDACAAAARARHMHVVRYLVERGYPYDRDATVAATLRHCDVEEGEWILRHKAACGGPASRRGNASWMIFDAAASSVVPTATAKLEWLLGCGERYRRGLLPRAAAAAAGADNLEGLQWVLGQVGEAAAELRERLLGSAARGKALRVTAWLLGQGGVVGERPVLEAAAAGHAEGLRLLLPRALGELPAGERQKALLEEAFSRAAHSRRLEAMQLVAEAEAARGQAEPAAPDAALLKSALQGALRNGGSVEAARWLWGRRGEAVEAPTVADALRAGSGTLMLAFLRDEAGADWGGAPWDVFGAVVSAGGDALAVLWWLQERGCPLECNAATTGVVLARGEPQLLQWLADQGLLGPAQLSDASLLECAVRSGCEAAVEWLLAAGCPMGQGGGAYLEAARNGDLDMLRCLRRLGVPWGPDTVLQAVEEGAVAHVVLWMAGEGGAPLDERALRAAREGSEVQGVLHQAAGSGARGAAAPERQNRPGA